MESLLHRLRGIDLYERVGKLKKPFDHDILREFSESGVTFAVQSPDSDRLETVFYEAIAKLLDCIIPNDLGQGILQEGGVYAGCWLESTGTINAELLSRYIPSVAKHTFAQFVRFQREDGLFPYKISPVEGPSFRQIQLVTPLARSVWHHVMLNEEDDDFLTDMYDALVKYDDWLAQYRDTRRTGCVEAFCTFDTGHDLSARFWHIPDTPFQGDPKRYDPRSPLLPLLAPDLTAYVYCSRQYYSRMARKLGKSEEESKDWLVKAEQTLHRLFEHCYDEEDEFFYDVDRFGRKVRIQSDVLLRVMACEVGDEALFAAILRRYLLNTRKFFAKYPLTSLALDDPRFDSHSAYNTWSGPTNLLTIIRTPRAFEHHQRYVELTWIMQPIISAMSRMNRFGQVISPWTGEEGYTESYSPAILGVLDYIERLCGILPTADGELWVTGLLPMTLDHGEILAEQTAYARHVDGRRFELVNSHDNCQLYRDGHLLCRFPAGLRLVIDREGLLQAVIGMSVHPVQGTLSYAGADLQINISGNQIWTWQDGQLTLTSDPGVIMPVY